MTGGFKRTLVLKHVRTHDDDGDVIFDVVCIQLSCTCMMLCFVGCDQPLIICEYTTITQKFQVEIWTVDGLRQFEKSYPKQWSRPDARTWDTIDTWCGWQWHIAYEQPWPECTMLVRCRVIIHFTRASTLEHTFPDHYWITGITVDTS